MMKLIEDAAFTKWLTKLRDVAAKAIIIARLDRVREGNFGDAKPVGAGISELRIAFGPGYRLYVQQRGTELVILLCGGDKSTQQADIAKAIKLADNWKNYGTE